MRCSSRATPITAATSSTALPGRRRPFSVGPIAVIIAAVAGIGLSRSLDDHEPPAQLTPSERPSPKPSPKPVQMHFRGDYDQGFDDGGYFRLQFVLVNDTGRPVTAQPEPLPSIPGIDKATTSLLPKGKVPRGGSASSVLQGHVTCIKN